MGKQQEWVTGDVGLPWETAGVVDIFYETVGDIFHDTRVVWVGPDAISA